MPLSGILGGFESREKHFFLRFLELKNKRKKQGKIRKYRKKNREISEKRNFDGDILSISTDNRYFGRNIRNSVPCLQKQDKGKDQSKSTIG